MECRIRPAPRGLNEEVYDSIDETLTELLSWRTREAIYDYLERNSSLARNDIPRRLEVLVKLLNAMFGKGGNVIGKAIAKKLYLRLQLEFEEESASGLIGYVEKVRKMSEKEVPSSSRKCGATYSETGNYTLQSLVMKPAD